MIKTRETIVEQQREGSVLERHTIDKHAECERLRSECARIDRASKTTGRVTSALRRSVEVFDKAGTVTRGQVERGIADDLDASASISNSTARTGCAKRLYCAALPNT
jgi:hypothetical protein